MKPSVAVSTSLITAGATALVLAMPVADRPIIAAPLDQNPQADVSITMSSDAARQKLALPDFLGTGNDPELSAIAKTIADVLWEDINYEREYYMIARTASARVPLAPPNALPYRAWADLGADQVLVGAISRDGANIVVDMSAVVVKTAGQGQRVFGKKYSNCRADKPRYCAHAIADDFHWETRALVGVARTKLAFSSDRANLRVAGRPSQTAGLGKEIYVADYDGGGPMRVTVNGHLNLSPVWSPTGGQLAYVSYTSHFPDIYIANLLNPGRLETPARGSPAVENWTPAWSPDGKKLAFASNRAKGGQTDVWVVNSDGSGLQNLTPGTLGSNENAPCWSPNGAQIAFTSDRTGVNQLFIMSAEGIGQRTLVEQDIDRPTWSPLNFIAFATDRAKSRHDIAIYDFVTGKVRVLTNGVGSYESPAIAPNGRHIAFVTTRWGKQDIATIDRAGENIRRVTDVGNNTYPNWQPKGW